MRVRTVDTRELAGLGTALLAIPVLKRDDGPILPELPEALASLPGSDPTATAGATRAGWIDPASGTSRVVFIGLGETAESLSAETLRRFAGWAVRHAESVRAPSLALWLPSGLEGFEAGRAAAEGAVLAAWRFRELKTGAGEEEPPAEVAEVALLAGTSDLDEVERGRAEGVVLAEAENVARVLQSRPGNVATPTHLADEATRLAAEVGLEIDVLGPERMREERMAALLAVAQGSDQEPRLIVLTHRGGAEGEKPLILVGKGLTFDAGGISIKPASGMEDMKFDMSGGAAVLAAMTAVARLGIPRNVIGIVPSSENLLGASAMKPGDVVTTRNGKTVEVINTDAEGRLILCDSLDYAVGMDPEAIVDCATLTGAVVVGLGHHAMAVLGNDEGVVDELKAAGEASGERAWPLPLWPEYKKQLESVTADMLNVGGRPAGTITAAIFLSEFVGDVPWGHLDIAGTAYGDGGTIPYRRKGGYGVPTRLLVEWVRGRAR